MEEQKKYDHYSQTTFPEQEPVAPFMEADPPVVPTRHALKSTARIKIWTYITAIMSGLNFIVIVLIKPYAYPAELVTLVCLLLSMPLLVVSSIAPDHPETIVPEVLEKHNGIRREGIAAGIMGVLLCIFAMI